MYVYVYTHTLMYTQESILYMSGKMLINIINGSYMGIL